MPHIFPMALRSFAPYGTGPDEVFEVRMAGSGFLADRELDGRRTSEVTVDELSQPVESVEGMHLPPASMLTCRLGLGDKVDWKESASS